MRPKTGMTYTHTVEMGNPLNDDAVDVECTYLCCSGGWIGDQTRVFRYKDGIRYEDLNGPDALELDELQECWREARENLMMDWGEYFVEDGV